VKFWVKGHGWHGFNKMNLWRQDKNQASCAAAFLRTIETGVPAIILEDIFEVADILRQQ